MGLTLKKLCALCQARDVPEPLLVELKFDSSNYSHLDLDVDPIV